MLKRLKSWFYKDQPKASRSKYTGYWPFDQPRNCAAMTMRQILEGSEPILLASHDADDHGWQFIGSTDANTADGRLISLEEMVSRDRTILQVADMLPGWQAIRAGAKYPWKRSRKASGHDNGQPVQIATSFVCSICHKTHNELPHVGADRPDQYWDVPEEKRKQDISLTEDTCEIAGKFFFIRGVIEIPVSGYLEGFGFGVWISQKKENFQKYVANFDSTEVGPFFGWLCTSIKYYENQTLELKTMAHFRGNGLRPSIRLEPCDHPLAIAQQQGISMDEALKIIHFYMENNSESSAQK